jgi:S1-C subfamily serine protease
VIREPGQTRGFATAFPLQEPGLFVTAASFLEGVKEIQVRTYANQILPASVLGFDLASGVGLIRAEPGGVTPLKVRDDLPAPEDGAWAICMPILVEDDPINLVRYWPQSLHRGRVTATGQSGTGLVGFEDLLRSDHSVPLSCRGGPLLDLRGSVVGLVAGSPDTGLTYAVPIAQVRPVAGILARRENPRWPYFGFGLVAVDDWRRARFGLDGRSGRPVVAYVIPGSPAETAGVSPGDLLTAVNGEPVQSVAEGGSRLRRLQPGETAARLTFVRQGKSLEISLTPAERPARILLAPIDELREALEIALEEVMTGPTSQHGLRVVDLVPGGRGDRAGYRRGDLIVSVNDRAVRHFESFNQIVRSEEAPIFAKDATYPTYYLGLDVKPEGKDRESRNFRSLFPGSLAPPVY